MRFDIYLLSTIKVYCCFSGYALYSIVNLQQFLSKYNSQQQSKKILNELSSAYQLVVGI